MVSEATGGKFQDGALTAMVIYLYNDIYENGLPEDINDESTVDFRKEHPNSFSIHTHGEPSGFIVNKTYFRKEADTEDMIKALKTSGWDGQQDIILFACNTGEGRNSIASYLSKILNVNVYAPTSYYAVPDDILVKTFHVQGFVTSKWIAWTYIIRTGEMKLFKAKNDKR